MPTADRHAATPSVGALLLLAQGEGPRSPRGVTEQDEEPVNRAAEATAPRTRRQEVVMSVPPEPPAHTAEPLAAAYWTPPGDLSKWDRNPRKNDKAVAQVARSIRRYGFVAPIVVWTSKRRIVAGHTRIKALELILAEEPGFVPRGAPGPGLVPVRYHEFKDEAEANAYAIADNKLSEVAEWDEEMLGEILAELARLDASLLENTGFSEVDTERLIREAGGAPSGDDPGPMEPPATPTTGTGDLWLLGRHRLLCGDSSTRADVDRLLGGRPVQLVNTDPPYNVRVEPRSNNAIAAARRGLIDIGHKAMPRLAGPMHHQGLDLARYPGKAKPTGRMRAKDRPLQNDFLPPGEFEKLLLAWFGNLARALVPGGSAYIWGGYANVANYPPAIAASGLYFSQSIIWVKEHPVLTRKDFMGNHEWCFYCWREGAAHWFNPDVTNATDVWVVKKVNPQSMIHLTEKPVELASRAILYSSPKRGDRVLDLFGGSGSTLVACEQAGRDALLMEIDPAYCDVIVDRWQRLTGARATLEGDGRAFEEIATVRGDG
jgi:DNA modification methylase